MKKILIAIGIVLSCFTVVQAQNKEVRQTVRMDTVSVDYKTRYTSSFGDNFYIEADFAGRMLMGEDDSHLSFGERLKPGFSITLGKWFHPDFGVRLNWGGSLLKGWNKGPTGIYSYDHGWVTEDDPVRLYWENQGVETKNGYRQDIKYYELNADLLFDLYNVFHSNKRLDRRWTTQGYVGVGMLRAKNYHGMERNLKIGFRLGVIGNYNITRRLGAHLAIGSEMTNSSFDGELGKGKKFLGILSGSVGLSYRIGKQGFSVVRLVPQEQISAMNEAISLIREEETLSPDTVRIVNKVTAHGSLLMPSVVFRKNKSSFNEELQMVHIFRVACYMQEHKDLKIGIIGNTGDVSDRLARNRAEHIRDILINKYGIAPERTDIQVYNVNEKYGVTGYEQSVNFSIIE